MGLWLNGAGALIWNGTALIDCPICPCPGEHMSPCNGTKGVPAQLLMTASFDGNTVDLPLDWLFSMTATCIGQEGWAYQAPSPEVVICSGLNIVSVALCCGLDDPDVWGLEIAVRIAGILDSFRTHGSGLDALTIVSTSPVHYTTQTTSPFSACSTLDTLLVDIQAP